MHSHKRGSIPLDPLLILINVAIPSDKNTSTKVSEKISKYKDLEIEITRMWQMKTEIIPVVIGTLGVIKKGSEKFMSKIAGNGPFFYGRSYLSSDNQDKATL